MSSAARLLVVDDSRDDVDFVQRALRLNLPELEVRVARSGSEALARLDEEEVDVVLLDLKMPGMVGHTVLQKIRSRWSQGELPVVVFTSSTEPGDIARAYENGANSFLVKPLVFERFAETVTLAARYWAHVNARQRVAPEG
ncbi:MAG: hypothetical protein AMXMBFR53_03720 [Gemmatimonadota bacterium]